MATKELRSAYNAKSTRQAIARAIRAEIEGGSQILADEANQSQRVQREGMFVPATLGSGSAQLTDAAKALGKARQDREVAENEIRRRYNMPPLTNQAAWRAAQGKA